MGQLNNPKDLSIAQALGGGGDGITVLDERPDTLEEDKIVLVKRDGLFIGTGE